MAAGTLLASPATVAAQDVTPGEPAPTAFSAATSSLALQPLVSVGIASQYLWRGRDFTFAAAPVAVTGSRVQLGPDGASSGVPALPEPGFTAALEFRTINAIVRRDEPWEAAAADTAQLGVSGGARLLDEGWLGVGLGVNVSFYYGALLAAGPAPGMIGIEPYLSIGLPALYGSPRLSAVGDLTPDQFGVRSGIEWFPEFETGSGGVQGYVGVFRPHNYFKQKSRSFLGELLRGQYLTALVSLIPSDLTLGASTFFELASGIYLEPELELMLVLNRPQNAAQIVPAATATFHYGAPEALPRVHANR
ncbi:MAG: hypothetical protein ACOC1U_11370 [Spirochaetota bacterium]